MTTPDDTTGKRPKPIELVARAMDDAAMTWLKGCWAAGYLKMTREEVPMSVLSKAAFEVLTKHGCISIEGIIARDEEMGK